MKYNNDTINTHSHSIPFRIQNYINNSHIQISSKYLSQLSIMSSSTPMVLITGANTGLGFETVRSLFRSQKTYTILLGGRSLDKANAAVDALRKEFPASKSTVQALQIDIEDDLSISKAFETVEGKFGRLDVLVNNAGKLFLMKLIGWMYGSDVIAQELSWSSRCLMGSYQ